MSKFGTAFLFIAVAAIGLLALFLAVNAGSGPFAIQMAIIAAGSALFLPFVWRRAKRF